MEGWSIKTVGARRLLYVMAVDAEYGAQLRGRFAPLMTGVGPVEAAVSLTRALCGLEAQRALPDLLVSLGSAGSRDLEQAAVYQATSVGYRDMDATPLGFAPGETPFLGLPAMLNLPFRVPGITGATLSTGGAIVSGQAYGTIAADMVDMETYSVVRACAGFGVPVIGLRGISDGAEDLHHIDDWTAYLHVIDERLAAAVDRLEAMLPELLPG